MKARKSNKPELRFKSRLRRDRGGLSSVITIGGIIAAIMGFVVAPLLTVYVPKWTKEAESEHMDEISNSFSKLRGNINNLIETQKVNGQSNVRIRLGTDLNNLFLPDSTGTVYLRPHTPELRLYNTNNTYDLYARSTGSIEYNANNHEYKDQRFIYENGAVIVEQDDKTTMDLLPPISINRHTGARTLLRVNDVFGNLPGYDTSHPRSIFYNFTGTSEELSISYEIYGSNVTIYENKFNSNARWGDWTEHKNDWFVEHDMNRTNVVAQWPFSEVQTDAFEEHVDTLGVLQGTFGGGATHKTGKLGDCIELKSATSARVSVANDNQVQMSHTHTIECWIYPYDRSGNKFIISKIKESASSGYGLEMAGDEIRYILGDGSVLRKLTTSGVNLRANQWAHVAGTWDGSKMRVYINGVQRGEKDFTGTVAINSWKLVFGSNQAEASGFFNGMIDEVILSSGAKTNFDINDGIFSVRGNIYGGEDECVATVDQNTESNIVIESQLLANDYASNNKNAFVVFDYQSGTSYKYAGIRPTDNKWVIGTRSAGGFTDNVSYSETLNTNTWYNMTLRIENNTVKLYRDDVLKTQYTFNAIEDGILGLGNDKAHSHFDNFKVYYNETAAIEMWLNGVFIGNARDTPPASWDGPFDKFLDEELIHNNQTNVFEFRNTFSLQKKWAIRIVEVKGNLYDLDVSAVTIECDEKTVGGSDSHILNLKLVSCEVNQYIFTEPGNITIQLTTRYPDAWLNHFDMMMNESILGLDWRKEKGESDFYIWKVQSSGDSWTVYLEVKRIYLFTCTSAVIEATFN